MIKPELLCRQHLLGEHNEIHKHKPSFEKKRSIKGRIKPVVQIQPLAMKKRHDEIAREMLRRGYDHESPYTMPDLKYLTKEEVKAKVDKKKSVKELTKRCQECKERIRG